MEQQVCVPVDIAVTENRLILHYQLISLSYIPHIHTIIIAVPLHIQ